MQNAASMNPDFTIGPSNNGKSGMNTIRRLAAGCAAFLLVLWAVFNWSRLTGDSDGTLRFILGAVFSSLIMLRWKGVNGAKILPAWTAPVCAVAGALLVVIGLVGPVRLAEWVGLLLVAYAALRWGLPPRFSGDTALALFVIFWIHPMPGNVTGYLQARIPVFSVRISEWILHCLNIHVWAHGATLDTGFRSFDVDPSCSGLRAAITVIMTVFGMSALLRLTVLESLVFLVAGVVQVLVLNVARIVFMVVWSARRPPEWGGTFLHDTLGLLVLAALALSVLEMGWWKAAQTAKRQRREAIASGEAEAPDRATMLPRFWAFLARWGWLVGLAAAAAFIGIVAARRSSPEHRAEMIAGTVEGLIMKDTELAASAVEEALALDPSNREMLSRRAQILIMRGQHDQALKQIQALPPPLSLMETIMKSWALMGLGRAAEAMALIDGLPEGARDHPMVAAVRAEFAAQQDKPDVVARNVATAARSHLTVQRARSLFPYLAAREQWKAISAADNPDVPFSDFAPALIAVEANLRIQNIARAADVMRRVLKAWPSDARLLGSLHQLAMARPDGEWSGIFDKVFVANIMTLDADRLASCLNHAFQMNRPDLGWLAYRRLAQLDPRDPAVLIAPARYGDIWFVFKRRHMGLAAATPGETVDLRPFIMTTRNLPPLRALWDMIPLADELLGESARAARERFLTECMAEIARREAEGRAAERVKLLSPTAMALAGRYEEAHRALDRLAAEFPERKDDMLYQHTLLYDREGRWDESYETLREYYSISRSPGITAAQLMAKALMNLNMAGCAMEWLQRARRMYPGARSLEDMEAAIWRTFGYNEHALFLLERMGDQADPAAMAYLLAATGRREEAAKAARVAGVVLAESMAPSEPPYLEPSAELSVTRRWPDYTSEAARGRQRAMFEKMRDEARGEFRRTLGRLGAEWYAVDGAGKAGDPATWRSAGRDELERGGLLIWLATLEACAGRHQKAETASRAALEELPKSVVLWRMLLALTEGERETVRRAREACPDDPDIWLASLVSRMREEGPGEWALKEIEAARGRFAPGTMVAAGDFMLRHGAIDAAAAAARDAESRSRGLLSSTVLSLQCALAARDAKWAEACALKGAAMVRDPSPFYRVLVEVKSAGSGRDMDTVAALEHLQERFKENPVWSERLGEAYFIRGATHRAMAVLLPVVEDDMSRVGGRSLVLAAEAARLEGRIGKAVAILEAAHRMYPDKLSVLNNLVYTLAQDSKTLPRARELLPRLLEAGGDNPAVLDTAAAVHLKSGDFVRAREYADRAVKGVSADDYAWAEILLNSAEVLATLGEYDQARERIKTVAKNPAAPAAIEARARELLLAVERESELRKR